MQFVKSEIIKLARQYNIGQIKSVKTIETSGNRSFIIVASKGKYFLRLCGEYKRYRGKKEIEGELDLIDLLLKNNFPVLPYLKTQTGKRVITINKLNGYLRKYSEAKPILSNPGCKQLLAVGKILGKYHKLVENLRLNKRNKINFDLDKTKGLFAEYKTKILRSNFKQAKQFVELYQKEINKIKFPKNLPKGMIHEDLGKRHMLWRQQKIEAIIDWDRTYYGELILDLGQTLRGWCFRNNWQKWSKHNCEIFLKGYNSERKLSGLERKYLAAAIKFAILERALSFYLRYIYSEKPAKADLKFALDSLQKQIKQIEI